MIRSFACRDTELLFLGQNVPRFSSFERIARRKLLQIHAAGLLGTLRIPPENHVEQLRGKRKGQYAIRINEQWRICFRWHGDSAFDVEIVDYH